MLNTIFYNILDENALTIEWYSKNCKTLCHYFIILLFLCLSHVFLFLFCLLLFFLTSHFFSVSFSLFSSLTLSHQSKPPISAIANLTKLLAFASCQAAYISMPSRFLAYHRFELFGSRVDFDKDFGDFIMWVMGRF